MQPGTNDAAVLTTVVTRNPIYVYFCVDEQALLKYQELALRQGKELHPKRLKDLKIPVEIGMADEKGFPHAGIINFADNKLDRTTGTLRVRGVFKNANEYLTPGLYVHVRIPFGDPHESLLAPERAIQRDQAEKYLLVVTEKVIKKEERHCGVSQGQNRSVAGWLASDRVWHRSRRLDRRRRAAIRHARQRSDARAKGSRAVGNEGCEDLEASRRLGQEMREGFPRCSLVSSLIARFWPRCRRFWSRCWAWRRCSRCRWPNIPRSRRRRSGSTAPIPAPALRWSPTRWQRPIEQQVNGVEDMLFMSSQCSNDGTYQLTVTFKVGTNLNMAQVLVQNRVALATPILPDIVKQVGVTVKKRSPDLMLMVHLISPNGRYDQLYLSNYAQINLVDEISRLEGVGDVFLMGQRDYSMRVWLDPDRLTSLGMTAGDMVRALREQNVQVAAGQIGQQPAAKGVDFQYTMTTLGRLTEPEQFAEIIIKNGSEGQIIRLRDVARVELGARNQDVNSYLDDYPAAGLAVFQLPGTNALTTAAAVKARMKELEKRFPGRPQVRNPLRHDAVHFRIDHRSVPHAPRRGAAGGPRRVGVPAKLAFGADSADCGAGGDHRHVRGDGGDGIQPQHAFAVRAGAGHRHRGGRRHCGGRGHRASHRARHDAAGRRTSGDERSFRAGDRDRVGALVRVSAVRIHFGHLGFVFPPVRPDDRGFDDSFDAQFADAQPGVVCDSIEAAARAPRPALLAAEPTARLVLQAVQRAFTFSSNAYAMASERCFASASWCCWFTEGCSI